MRPFSANVDPAAVRRQAAQRFLDARIDYERAWTVPYRARELKLERMRELLDRLGNPHLKLAVVHVAGTKGKGSTAAMLGAMLSAAGYRTGLFTSPHLDSLEERIAIDGRPCSPAELVELVDRVQPAVYEMDQAAAAAGDDEIGPTYFELTSAMAMLHFARRNVDAAVLEVGLGGRLDSTNVCRPRVSVITSISFDHTRQLGNTLASIAGEKAGIIKPGVPVVSGVARPEPHEVIRTVCAERGCRLIEIGVDFDFAYRPPPRVEPFSASGEVDFRWHGAGGPCQYRALPLALLGAHQGANAAVALAVLLELKHQGWAIPDHALRTGLAEVRWPARIEVLGQRPTIVVDVAHNAASIEALLQVLDESLPARRRLLVFAASREKDVTGMLRQLLGAFDEVIFTRYVENPRALPPEELEAIAAGLSGRRYPVCPDPSAAWQEVCRRVSPDDLVCATGSFFIAAEMRKLIQSRPIPAPVEDAARESA